MDASSTLLDGKSQPRLPVELERIIFDMTAFPSDVPLAESRTRAAGLMLVAKRVREWIRPKWYSIFVLGLHRDSSERDLNFPPSTMSKDRAFMENVSGLAKHLFIGDDTTDDSILSLLESCVNTQDLALGLDYYRVFESNVGEACLSAICDLKDLKRLKLVTLLTQKKLSRVEASSVGETLTHLDILYPALEEHYGTETYGWGVAEALSGFRALSHLSLTVGRTPIEETAISQIIALCILLRVFIIKAFPNPIPKMIRNIWATQREYANRAVDSKACLALMPVIDEMTDLEKDWERGVRGQEDTWLVAERFVDARRQHFFLDASLDWICTHFPSPDALTEEGRNWFSTFPGFGCPETLKPLDESSLVWASTTLF